MKPRITVVGSVNMDLVFRTPRMPAVGETLHGHAFCQVAGGKGANQAVAAARQGAEITFIGAIGDDNFGVSSRQSLGAEKIDLTYLTTSTGIATGVAGILVDDSGNNSIVVTAGANATLSVAHIDAASAVIAATQFLICQLETPLPTVTRAIELAHAHGVRVIFNPAPAQALPDTLLAMTDYLVVNETEASQLSGIEVTGQDSARQAAQALLGRGALAVLLTMGEHGTMIADKNGDQFIPAISVDVIDTTAAGDTFVGAFAVGLANGLTLYHASVEAQYAAALAVTKLGAQTSIPTRQEVLEFMARKTPGHQASDIAS